MLPVRVMHRSRVRSAREGNQKARSQDHTHCFLSNRRMPPLRYESGRVVPTRNGFTIDHIGGTTGAAPLSSLSIVQFRTADQQGCAHRAATLKYYAGCLSVSFENARQLQATVACKQALTAAPAAVLHEPADTRQIVRT
jgi:hypothetical protein